MKASETGFLVRCTPTDDAKWSAPIYRLFGVEMSDAAQRGQFSPNFFDTMPATL